MTQDSVCLKADLDAETVLSHELSTAQLLVNYHGWIYSEIQPFLNDHLTEIGGGIGTFSDHLIRHHVSTRQNRSIDIFEPADGLFLQLKKHCQSRYEELLCSGRVRLRNEGFNSRVRAFDSAIMINVLEHIENDRDIIRGIHTSLNPGGTLIVFSPALPFLYSPLDKRLGHFRRYGKRELASMFEASGFAIAKLQYMDIAGVLPWYLINALAGSCSFNPSLVRIYDRVVVPITRWIEHCCRAPVGKNVLIVGRKPLHSTVNV
jgi:SAM-dependent methyltransferase